MANIKQYMGAKKRRSGFPELPELLLQQVRVDTRLKIPPLYQVYLLNDDYTPMDFVVAVLEQHFLMGHAAAIQIMLRIHQSGRANCGLYTKEIAETKVVQVNEYARRNQHPLLCKMEAADTE